MATLKELEDALIKADAAGNAADAKVFADEIRRRRTAQPAAQDRDFNKGPSTGRQAFTQGLLGNPQGITIADDPTLMKAIADGGLEAGGAALGQVVGGMAPGPLKPVGMAAGRALGGAGGNLLAQSRRIAMGEQEGYQPGQAVGAGVASIIPGGNMAKAPVRGALKGAASNLAAAGTETVVDQGRAPTGTEAATVATMGAVAPVVSKLATKPQVSAIQKTLAQQTVDAARQAGYVLSPSSVRPTFLNRQLESIGGKAATLQEAAIRNAEVTNALARKELGLKPEKLPLTSGIIDTAKAEAGAVFDEVAKLSPKAAKQLEQLKAARFQASAYYKFYDNTPDPAVLKKAQKWEQKASELEADLDLEAMSLGRKDLVPTLREARTKYAKAMDIERAMNSATGDVSAEVLERAAKSGKPFTGGLKTIVDTRKAFPSVMRDAAKVPTPGVGKLRPFAGAVLAGAGGSALGPFGALAGLAPLADGPVRGAMLSKPFQDAVANRFINGATTESAIPLAFRLGSMSAGRNAFLER